MKIIDEVKHEGGKILSFSSVCGGLPAPEASDNPLGYKFSWSPRGVLSAGLNPSKYLNNGKVGLLFFKKEQRKKVQHFFFFSFFFLARSKRRQRVSFLTLHRTLTFTTLVSISSACQIVTRQSTPACTESRMPTPSSVGHSASVGSQSSWVGWEGLASSMRLMKRVLWLLPPRLG